MHPLQDLTETYSSLLERLTSNTLKGYLEFAVTKVEKEGNIQLLQANSRAKGTSIVNFTVWMSEQRTTITVARGTYDTEFTRTFSYSTTEDRPVPYHRVRLTALIQLAVAE